MSGDLNSTEYIDGTNYSSFCHLNHRSNNFVEKVGSRFRVVDQTPTTSPFSAPAVADFMLRKLSQIVSLEIPGYTAVVNQAASTIVFTALIPADHRPKTTITLSVVLVSNAVPVTGYVQINASTGTVTFVNFAGNFTNAAVGGLLATQIMYDTNL